MEPWFGPRPGTNPGEVSFWKPYQTAPKSWEGWVLQLIYYAGLIGIGYRMVHASGLDLLLCVVGLVVWHIGFKWVVSHHYG